MYRVCIRNHHVIIYSEYFIFSSISLRQTAKKSDHSTGWTEWIWKDSTVLPGLILEFYISFLQILLLFSQMKEGEYVDTLSSLKENKGEFSLALEPNQAKKHKYKFNVIDFPGASRLRGHFEELIQTTPLDCIIFVIDSTSIRTDVHEISQFVFMFSFILKKKHALFFQIPNRFNYQSKTTGTKRANHPCIQQA